MDQEGSFYCQKPLSCVRLSSFHEPQAERSLILALAAHICDIFTARPKVWGVVGAGVPGAGNKILLII